MDINQLQTKETRQPWDDDYMRANGLSWIGFLRLCIDSRMQNPLLKKKKSRRAVAGTPWKAVLDRRAAAGTQWATPAGWASKRTEMASSTGPDGLVGVSPDRRISARSADHQIRSTRPVRWARPRARVESSRRLEAEAAAETPSSSGGRVVPASSRIGGVWRASAEAATADGCRASAEAVPTCGVLVFKTTDGDRASKASKPSDLGCVSELLFPSISRIWITAGVLPGRERGKRQNPWMIWIAAGVLPGRERGRRLHLPKMSKLKQDVFDKAHEKAVAATTRKRPRQCSYNDLETIRITSMPTVLQLLQMYKQVHNLFVEHSAALILRNVSFPEPDGGIPTTFKADFLDGVPIALPFDEQNLSFFILEVITDDDAVFQFPMRLDSLYCCGFRCLELCDNPLEKLWYSFGKVSILPKRLLKNRQKSGLSLAYNNFRKIQIFAGVIAKFCDHFRGFRPVDSADDDRLGQQLKDTLYFIFSEACRFWFAMCVTVKGFQSEAAAPVRLTDLMGDLIQDYGDTSRLGVYLWLAFLEKRMELAATCLHDPGRFPDLLLAFATEAKNFVKYTEADPEFDNQPLIKFKRSSDDLCLGALDGESLFIVKYSCVLIRKALMRDAAYARIFPVMEPISGEDVNCYDD